MHTQYHPIIGVVDYINHQWLSVVLSCFIIFYLFISSVFLRYLLQSAYNNLWCHFIYVPKILKSDLDVCFSPLDVAQSFFGKCSSFPRYSTSCGSSLSKSSMHADTVTCLAVSHCKTLLVSGSRDQSVARLALHRNRDKKGWSSGQSSGQSKMQWINVNHEELQRVTLPILISLESS